MKIQKIYLTDCAHASMVVSDCLLGYVLPAEALLLPTEALLLGLLTLRGTAIERLLQNCDINAVQILANRQAVHSSNDFSIIEEKKLLNVAVEVAMSEVTKESVQSRWIDTAHLLVALTEQKKSYAAILLNTMGLDSSVLHEISSNNPEIHALSSPNPNNKWDNLYLSLGFPPKNRASEVILT